MSRRNKIFILMALVLAVGTVAAWRFAFAGPPAPALDQSIDQTRTRVELSFDYASQSGMASNQIAAWVPEMDAISRATPSSGTIRYAWYCDDMNGKPVPAGQYIINLEASLRWENRVLYQATILLGGESKEERPEPTFFGSSTAERGMVTSVAVRYQGREGK